MSFFMLGLIIGMLWIPEVIKILGENPCPDENGCFQYIDVALLLTSPIPFVAFVLPTIIEHARQINQSVKN